MDHSPVTSRHATPDAESPPGTGPALKLFERMVLIRTFEEQVSRLYRGGEVPGFVHLSIGQEAVAVGACSPLTEDDVITSTHRGHGHCLAKGLDPAAMMAELMGKDAGTNRGRGGSMHIADPLRGIFGANGIVAGGIPIAVGAATASHLRGRSRVVIAFFGDGAVANGAFHEAVNLAALWRLPVIFLCENNGYAEFSATAQQQPVSLQQRAQGYGLAWHLVDGNDVRAVADLVTPLVAAIRAGGGPVIVEATTYRWHGHYEGDPELYRDERSVLEWRATRDPIELCANWLLAAGVTEPRLRACRDRVTAQVDAAVEFARRAAIPETATVGDHVYRAPVSGRSPVREPEPVDSSAPTFKGMDAVHDALALSLARDPHVFVAGVDVGSGGNVFGLTRGLKDRWPDRVLDTPISETAVVGMGIGAAMAGMRPVVEIMYLDFIGVCFDQILNQAAKLGFMTGGRASIPLTIRTQFGVGRSSGSQHSQSLEALLAHIPGLKVVMPAEPADVYGLLRASILDPDPVIVIENRLLYGRRGPRPPEDHVVPIGVARIARPGSDATVVAWSQMVIEALAAAETLAAEGISIEVIDLRTVAPIDFATIHASVTKTSRLLIAQQSVRQHGLGAEIAARLCVDGFWDLDAPIARLGGPFAPVPYSPGLERAWLPGRDEIVESVRDLVRF